MLYKLNQRVFIGIAGMLTYPRLIANPHLVCNRVCFHSVRLAEGVKSNGLCAGETGVNDEVQRVLIY